MMRVLGDRVLVALPPREEAQDEATGYTYLPHQTTESGLILAKPSNSYQVERASRGIVYQVGRKHGLLTFDSVMERLRDARNEIAEHEDREGERTRGLTEIDLVIESFADLAPAPFEVSVGDCVLFPPSAGELVSQDGIDYVILRESEILGIVEPITRQEAA